MRLFASLLFNVKPTKPKLYLPEGFKGPKGHIFRGKYRLVKKVTNEAVEDLKEQIKIEEKNMLYLRHPFLTAEESSGHAKELEKNKKWYMKKLEEREDKFTNKTHKNKSIVQFLDRIRISEDWDRIPS